MHSIARLSVWLALFGFVVWSGAFAAPASKYKEIEGGKISQSEYDKYLEFNNELQASLNERDPSLFKRSVNVERFAENVLSGLKLSRSERKQLEHQARQSIEDLGEVLLEKLGEEGEWKFVRLRMHKVDGADQVTALVRIDLGKNGLTYWEFNLRIVDGHVKIDDWYNFSLGQLMSDAVKHLSGLVYSQGSESLSKEFGGAEIGASDQKELISFMEMYREGNYKKALRSYHKLPDQVRNDPLLMVVRVEAASGVSERAYKRALADLAEQHGDDPRFALLLIDYFFYQEDYARTHAILDNFSQMIGGDAALDSLHANIAYQEGNYKDAIEYCRRAISNDADYEDPYWTLLDLMVFQGQYDDAVLVLKILQDRFYYVIDAEELAKIKEYTDFSKSASFKQWAANTN